MNQKLVINEIIGKYPDRRSAIMPLAYLFQDRDGFIKEEVMVEIAHILNIRPVEVFEAISYYTMFRREPQGKYLIQVCTNLSCSLLGAENILGYLEKKLNIREGETTPDGKFSLLKVQCLGHCGTAPVMQINDDYYENLTLEKIDKILDGLQG